MKGKKIDPSKVQGGDMIPLYSNVGILARKLSGKTTVIYNILKNCSNRRTKTVFIFSSTVNKDPAYEEIQNMLADRGIPVMGFQSVEEVNGVNNVEIVYELLQQDMGGQEQKGEGKEPEKPKTVMLFGDESEEEPEKEKKPPKKIAPEYFIIFDDLGVALRNQWVAKLLKTNRHFKATCLVSFHYLTDLPPDARKQLDVFLLFQKIDEDRLKSIYETADPNVSFTEFIKLYHQATREQYNFLFLNPTKSDFRRNFNSQLKIISSKK